MELKILRQHQTDRRGFLRSMLPGKTGVGAEIIKSFIGLNVTTNVGCCLCYKYICCRTILFCNRAFLHSIRVQKSNQRNYIC